MTEQSANQQKDLFGARNKELLDRGKAVLLNIRAVELLNEFRERFLYGFEDKDGNTPVWLNSNFAPIPVEGEENPNVPFHPVNFIVLHGRSRIDPHPEVAVSLSSKGPDISKLGWIYTPGSDQRFQEVLAKHKYPVQFDTYRVTEKAPNRPPYYTGFTGNTNLDWLEPVHSFNTLSVTLDAARTARAREALHTVVGRIVKRELLDENGQFTL
jgi:hypothetical protein